MVTAAARELVLASAGTGKTYHLTTRIIGLLAKGEDPGVIFASTFTRKAAGEILDRVLVRLARAALDDGEARALAFATGAAGPRSAGDADEPADPAEPAFWAAVLQRVVRQLHRLDIGTLDAFFVRAVGSFAHDLGLPARWTIAAEPVAVRARDDALAAILGRLDEGARIELVRGVARAGAERSVHDALARHADALLEVQHALDPAAPGWAAMLAADLERVPDLHRAAIAAAERLEEAPLPLTAGGVPDSRWVKPRDKLAAMLRNGDWDTLACQKLFTSAVHGPGEFAGKPYPPAMEGILRDIAVLARQALGTRLIAQAAALARLAGLYADAFDLRLRQLGALRFDDVTRLVGGREPLGGRGDLYYRLDGRRRHMLLDEFQDTSRPQWAALEPLVDGVLADGAGSAVIVADPKQSIYGWCGGA
jgi:ATP-dependent helicase/nuclease subunit A